MSAALEGAGAAAGIPQRFEEHGAGAPFGAAQGGTQAAEAGANNSDVINVHLTFVEPRPRATSGLSSAAPDRDPCYTAPMADTPVHVQSALARALDDAAQIVEGEPATYIPELANAPLDATAAAAQLVDGSLYQVGDVDHQFTLQSSAKLVTLIGLLEEQGSEAVFSKVGQEPSGSSFASLARLDQHGTLPANPLINAGAIALCGMLRGNLEDRLAWLDGWIAKLYGAELNVNQRVWASERRTGDRNRSIAYLLKSSGIVSGDVEQMLELYFSLCSYEATVSHASRLAAILASGGVAPDGKRVISLKTVRQVTALMATCGMYDESGAHLARTGLPAKSGVSGVIVAVATGRAGLAVFSPRLNTKGSSVRGHAMLRMLSDQLDWHMAAPVS